MASISSKLSRAQEARLHRRAQATVPFVQQLEWTDCGAASLCMVMAYPRPEAKLAEVREAMGIGRDGVSAKAILDTAERYGLRAAASRSTSRRSSCSSRRRSCTGSSTTSSCSSGREGRRPHRRSGDRPARRAAGRSSRRRSPASRSSSTPTPRFTKTKDEKGRLERYCDELLAEKGLFSRVIVVSLVAAPDRARAAADDRHDHRPRRAARRLPPPLRRASPRSAAWSLFNLIAEIVRAHLLLHLRIALDTRMTLGFLDHMVSLPFAFFQRRSTGDLMMRVDSNGTVREIVTSKSHVGA